MKKFFYLILILLFIFFFLFYILKTAKHYPDDINLKHEKEFFGLTYSKKQAEDLELNWKEAYIDILDELKVKNIRIPVYWDEVEKEKGVFDFSDYIFMIEEGEKRDVKFILTFGMRTPRWPECHIPSWIDIEDTDFLQERTLKMIEKTIKTFQGYENIAYWQVENEPLLNSFGLCPSSDYLFLKKEIKKVKEMDDRPVIISATGELSFWAREAGLSDVLAVTMYRVVHNKYFGYIRYPYSSDFYSAKAKFLKVKPKDVFVVELQAEPWVSKEKMLDFEDREYEKSFNIEQFEANAQIAINTGFAKAYFWGVEWWYLRHKKGGDSSYWDLAKTFFK
jgi:hypothetical protein